MPTTNEESVKSFDAEDQDRRRKGAYRLYKRCAKPTRENMCRILDYAKDTDITRKDVDLLPWNPEKTEVIKGAMKSSNKKQKTEKKDKKKDKEVTALSKSNGSDKRSTLLQRRMGDSSTNLGIFRSGSSSSLDTSTRIWDEEHTRQVHRVSADKLQTLKVEEEQKRRREQRQRKREDVTKKIVPEVGVQDKRTTEDTKSNIKAACLERTYQWYTRMGSPIKEDFKRRVADVKSIDITPEDVDLLPWNLTERVVNIAKMNAIIRASISMKQ